MAEEDRDLSSPSTSTAVPFEIDDELINDEDGDEEMILVSLFHSYLFVESKYC